MWHSVRLLTSVLGLAMAAGAAQAEPQPQASIEVPLGMAIAIQGDQALEDIRAEVTAGIAGAIEQRMVESLHQALLMDAAAGGAAAPDDVIVMAIDR